MTFLERTNFLGRGNDPFQCLQCGADVRPLRSSFRNHCPVCLWSLHVDRIPGDRAESCGGLMEPVGLEGAPTRGGKGWDLVHRCTRCGAVRRIQVAADDPEQPDSWDALIDISTRVLGSGPAEDRRPRGGKIEAEPRR